MDFRARLPRAATAAAHLWAASLALAAAACDHAGPAKASGPWVAAYLRADKQDVVLSATDVDYGAVTHLIHFSVRPNADGTLDTSVLTAAKSAEAVAAAHAAERKILVCVGGSSSAPGFGPAIAAAVRPTLIANLLALMVGRGYDGIDLDFEPLTSAYAADFAAFVADLRTALAGGGALLTAAPSGTDASQPSLFASLAGLLDQVNVQTYNLSGTSTGVTWHNGALYDGGLAGPSGRPLPSCDGAIGAFLSAGVPAAKLGLGIDFAGKVWAGASGPDESLAGVTAPTPITYAEVMAGPYSPAVYHFDAAAGVPYLGIAGASPEFVSYDDGTSCAEKVGYVRGRGLGGVMIWELSAGWRSTLPTGQRDPLLQAIKNAL